MAKYLVLVCTLLLCLACEDPGEEEEPGKHRAQEPRVGVRSLNLEDQANQRHLDMEVWYPAVFDAHQEDVTYHDYYKASLSRDSEIEFRAERYPLILFSHQHQGRPSDILWLAEFLVKQHFIVAALKHPGDTEGDINNEVGFQIWKRPVDMSYALNELIQDPILGDKINQNQIVMVGHGVGAFTPLSMGGARYNINKMLDYCESQGFPQDCKFAKDIDRSNIKLSEAGGSFLDERIRALILFSPGLGPGFSEESFEDWELPTKIFALEKDVNSPLATHAQHYQALIPATHFTLFEGLAQHSVFLPICQDPGRTERPQLCLDDSSVNRGELHQNIQESILEFLNPLLEPSE